MKTFRYALPIGLLLLTACASKTPRAPVVAPPPQAQTEQQAPATEAPPAVEIQPAPLPKSSEKPAPKPAPQAPASSPALLALMQEAEAESASGELDNAAASLERAIRIAPRNAELWHRLAEVRLKQHQPGLAEDLAKKSNVLAKGDTALTRKNWAIIADARRKKGDAEGAAEADAKAAR